MNRRNFLGIGGTALVGSTITWPVKKNYRRKHFDELIYRGIICLPREVIHHALAGRFYRTTSRHDAIRFKIHGVLFLFRELTPSLNYFGEIVRTQDGQTRVHLWKVISQEGQRGGQYVLAFGEHGSLAA